MFLRTGAPSYATCLSRHDSVFVLVLAMTLLLSTTTFFGPFGLGAIGMGILLSVALHHYTDGQPPAGIDPDGRMPIINISAIHIGGDAGGLIFVCGSVVILALGLPGLRWFLVASLFAAGALAWIRIAMRFRESAPSARVSG